MSRLPRIMVAPTGARRSIDDHPALPVTIDKTVSEARACYAAGAEGIHAHIRDSAQRHTLDAGLYRELLTELSIAVPDMLVQVTTESVGRYSSKDQRDLVQSLRPDQVSIALREISADEEDETLRSFFHWAQDARIGIQHILYSPSEVALMEEFVSKGVIPSENLELIFVLGNYGDDRTGRPADLNAFLAARQGALAQSAWAVCAFGRHETACLLAALGQGGKARIGFENNLLNADGSMASSNAARVVELVGLLAEQDAAMVETPDLDTRHGEWNRASC